MYHNNSFKLLIRPYFDTGVSKLKFFVLVIFLISLYYDLKTERLFRTPGP